MPKNKNSLKVPTYLKKIGFDIAGTPEPSPVQQAGWWVTWGKFLDPIFRHPIVLLLLTSALSIGIGSWLTAAYQERQREREATVRSMDELRGMVDDISLAFQQYGSAATHLLALKEAGGPADQLTAAQAAYNEANERWQLKAFGDLPNVRQRMPGNRGGDATVVILEEISMGALTLDACLEKGAVESVPGIGAKKRIVCTLQLKGFPELSADDRIGRLTRCVTLFHLLVRPDPKNDFDSEAQTQTKLGDVLSEVQKVCGPTLL
ncbi:hypothetical protein [Caballeronia sp. KNU42]